MNGSPRLDELIARCGLDASRAGAEPATSVEYRVRPERTVELLADTLARLHDVELTDDERAGAISAPMLAEEIGAAHRSGRLVGAARTPSYAHVSNDRLVEILRSGATSADERSGSPTLTHGSPTLANLRCSSGSAVGLVTWSDAAVAERYRDLAIAARSVAVDLAPILVPVFFERYGATSPDAVLLDWYSLAAELWPGADPGG